MQNPKKTLLSPQQSRRLLEAGIPKRRASKSTPGVTLVYTGRAGLRKDSQFEIPLFTLDDLLRIIPKQLDYRYPTLRGRDCSADPLRISYLPGFDEWQVMYSDYYGIHEDGEELIDVLYSVILILLEKELIELDKL